MALVAGIKRKRKRRVSKTEGPYKLTPHFTEGSSLISSRFFSLSTGADTRHSFKFHPGPPFLGPRGARRRNRLNPVLLFAHFSGCLTAINQARTTPVESTSLDLTPALNETWSHPRHVLSSSSTGCQPASPPTRVPSLASFPP